MKKIITKFWGVGLVVILLTTMFVGAAPVANAATLAWSVSPTPDTLGITNQIVPAALAGLDVASLQIASNGDLFAINTFPGVDVVYKSVNGGLSWTASVPVVAGLVDLAISPSYATDNTLFVLAAGPPGQVYISTNGGISFSVLGGAVPVAAEVGTSLAVSPTYSGGTGEIMVGTQDPAAATYGNLYIWGRFGVLNWVDVTALTEDWTKVAFSPNFAIDATRLAVGSAVGVGTRLHTLVAADAAFDATLPLAVVIATTLGTGDAVPIASSTIAMPSDYNASLPFNRTLYVGVVSGSAADDVYRVITGLGLAVAMGPLTVIGVADHTATSLVYSGTGAAGTLYVGTATFAGVFFTATPTAAAGVIAASWGLNVVAPTGATLTSIALANDFATSRKMYAGTTGVESALSVSTDGGLFFYQVGLIDTALAAINDFVAANATTFYMVTSNGAFISVWKTVDSGVTWYRYRSVASALTGIIRVSPNYATDSTLIFGIVTSGAAGNVATSNNAGVSWTARTSPVAVGDIAVKDQYTYYIASSAASWVQSTANGGWTWLPVATVVTALGTAISDIEIDLATGALLAGNNVGGIFRSTNANLTWLPLGAALTGTTTIVEFDANYASNGMMYAANTAGGTADIKRFATGYTAWLAVGSAIAIASAADFVSAPDGTLYVSNIVGAAGMSRSINPTAGFPTISFAGWNNAIGGGLLAGSTLGKMAYAPGSNVIYAIDTTTLLIYTYTDTLTIVTPALTSPADASIFPAPALVVLTWDSVAGALSYDTQIDTRADYANLGGVVVNILFPFTARTVVGLAPGVTYFWHVRVSTPVLGPWSQSFTFQTQLAPAAPNAPPILSPAANGTGAGGTNAAVLPTFSWGPVPGATNFEFLLAKDAAMTDLIVDATGANALGNVTAYQLGAADKLAYSSTYYWQVRAISGTSQTAWSAVVVFTTMAAPVVAGPPVVITSVPAPTIVIPAPPQATQIVIPAPPPVEEINPTYIWAIIIIGAVLVIAVIVLIVRTRRTV